jgi:hypothetical protein
MALLVPFSWIRMWIALDDPTLSSLCHLETMPTYGEESYNSTDRQLRQRVLCTQADACKALLLSKSLEYVARC